MSNGEDEEPDRVWREGFAPGVYVDAYEDGSIKVDKRALANRVENKIDQKVGQWTCGCVAQLLAGLALMLMIGGAGAYFVFNPDALNTVQNLKPPAGAGQAAAVNWDGTSPLGCSGNDSLTVSGVRADLPGKTAVLATSNCKLTLVDCHITAGIGIKASGNARVTVQGGTLTGSQQAVDASSNASVQLIGVKTSGARKSGGNAEIQERRK